MTPLALQWLAGFGAIAVALLTGWLTARAQQRWRDDDPVGNGCLDGAGTGCLGGVPDDALSTGCCLAAVFLQLFGHLWIGLVGLPIALALAVYAWPPHGFLAAWNNDPADALTYLRLLAEPAVWAPLAALVGGFWVSRVLAPQRD